MKINKKLISVCILMAGLTIGNASWAQWAVIDTANLNQSIAQVNAWKNQYSQMSSQLSSMQQTYKSMSGVRNMGNIANNPNSRQYLPTEYSTILSQGVGQWEKIRAMSKKFDIEKSGLSTNSDSSRAFQQAANQAAINRAVAETGYSNASQRFAEIQKLLDKINSSPDPKDIADLQARIQAEQVMMQNEANKLQMLQQLAQAQRDLQTQQMTEIRMKSIKGGLPPGW